MRSRYDFVHHKSQRPHHPAVLFQAFDINGDGYVCSDDLAAALSHIAGAAVPRAQLAHVAASTVAVFDHDNDDRLSAEEFAVLLQM